MPAVSEAASRRFTTSVSMGKATFTMSHHGGSTLQAVWWQPIKSNNNYHLASLPDTRSPVRWFAAITPLRCSSRQTLAAVNASQDAQRSSGWRRNKWVTCCLKIRSLKWACQEFNRFRVLGTNAGCRATQNRCNIAQMLSTPAGVTDSLSVEET